LSANRFDASTVTVLHRIFTSALRRPKSVVREGEAVPTLVAVQPDGTRLRAGDSEGAP